MPIKQVLTDQRIPVKIWTDEVDDNSKKQLTNIASLPFIHHHVAAMPDVQLTSRNPDVTHDLRLAGPGDKYTWTINSKLVNVNSAGAHIEKEGMEIWDIDNPNGGWSHPVHIHFEEGHILQRFRNGVAVAVPPHEKGRKDVYVLGPNERIRLFLRFRDFPGKYVMHCHNMIHEDHAMMVRWDIVE